MVHGVRNSVGTRVIRRRKSSVLIESVNLVVVVVLGWHRRHVRLLTLRSVLCFFHPGLHFVLQKLGVLLTDLYTKAVKLHSFTKQLGKFCRLLFYLLIAVNNSLLDCSHLLRV